MNRLCKLFAAGVLIIAAAGCGGKKDKDTDDIGGTGPLSAADIEAAKGYQHPLATAYYKENPEAFTFATVEDLPAGLTWLDGTDQPELGSPEAKKGGTINYWIQDFPRTLRYQGPDANGSFRRYINDDNNQHLVDRHPGTGKYVAILAESWAIGNDKRTIFFKLEKNATYSDGVAITADDYLFTMYFMRSPWLQGPWYNNHYEKKYTNITKYDDHTISITLDEIKPDPLLLFEEDVRPTPRHFYKEFSETYVADYQWKLEPTTGPYTILPGDVKKGREVTQTRLKNWWAKDKKFVRYRFNPDKRRFTVMRDVNKMREAFLQGKYDMLRIRVPETWHDKVVGEELEKGYIHRAQYYNEIPRPTWALYMNQTKTPLDNKDVRIGLQHAVNFELVLEKYFRGDFVRMRTSSDGYGRFTHPTLQPRTFSIEKAEAAFARAGFAERGGDGIFKNASGERLSVTVTLAHKRFENVLPILEREARKAGVELKLEVLDATSGWKKVQEKKHEIMLTALSVSVEPYPRYHDFFHSYNAFETDGSLKSNTNNFTVTSTPEYDSLIEKYDTSQNFDEIMTIGHQLEEKIYEDAAYIPGWVRPYMRCAYWRWVQWPEGFNEPGATEHDEYHLYWIDEAAKEETLAARKADKAYPATTLVINELNKN